MALEDNILVFPPELLPDNDVDPVGGDIDESGGELDQSGLGAIFPTGLRIPATGEGDESYYYPIVIKNDDGTLHLQGPPRFYIRNGLALVVSQSVFTVSPQSASESGKIRLYFIQAGSWTTEDLTCTGTTVLTSTKQGDAGSPVIAQKLSSGGALQNATGSILIACGGSLGFIPAGHSNASSLFRLGLDPTVNNTLEADDRLTAPAGVTFDRAYTYDDGLEIAGPDNLDAGQFIKAWLELTLFEEMEDVVDFVYPFVFVRGTSS